MTVLGNGVKCVCCNLGIESTNVIDGQKVSWSMPLKIIFQVTRLDCPNVGRRKGRQLVVVAMAPNGHSQKQLSFKSRIGKKFLFEQIWFSSFTKCCFQPKPLWWCHFFGEISFHPFHPLPPSSCFCSSSIFQLTSPKDSSRYRLS